jgi:DNA-binding CsgD family transcriptional regulator
MLVLRVTVFAAWMIVSPGGTMSPGDPEPALLGRRTECDVLDRLLESVRAGESRVLAVRGEPGVGKSALLEYLVARASGFRIARATGVESEMELAYAGLHQLCAPLLDRRARLPGPQRDALATVFGLSAGPSPDRFLVGLAVLGLLSEVAEERPLVCVIDDAQWLDHASAQTLAFVARRLLAEAIGVVFAVREPSDLRELAGLPELRIGGLSDGDSRTLLTRAIPGRLDERIRDQIVAETRGNPLALLELPRGLTPAELAGGFGLLDAKPLAIRIEESFVRRSESLSDDAQRLLLLAAAEPTGDVSLLWRATGRLGLHADAVVAAQASGLIDLGARVRFHHPLVRSAVYRSAPPPDRRQAHRALAEATDAEADPDRRAWHRAHAADAPDEDVAAELERSAGRAAARGGVAAAAAFLERSAFLTPDPVRRAQRALDAAEAKFQAGALEPAAALLATAEAGPLDELRRARIDILRAQIAFAQRRGNEAAPLLLDAARRLEPLDARLARETYLEALRVANVAGLLSGNVGVLEVATAARAAPPAPPPERAIDLLLDGLAMIFTEGYAAAVPLLHRALDAFRWDAQRGEDNIRGLLWLAWVYAADAWDDETLYEVAERAVKRARDAGALAELPIALEYLVGAHMHAGELAAAAALLDEATAITAATGYAPLTYNTLVLLAWRGDEAQAVPLIDARIQDAIAKGEGLAIGRAAYASAVLYNGLGRYDAAVAAAQRACEHEDFVRMGYSFPELIEASVRCGVRDVAATAMRRLEEHVSAARTGWALGTAVRSRALLSDGHAAETLYLEAIEQFARSRCAAHLARAHLVYGEWLRRENRRQEAREQLRTAHEMFSRMGAEAFAERARRELLATGETARRRTVERHNVLTPQEAQIARLAREGLSNPEIGAQLFISPRTAQYHLGKVFAKLDITSRNQLLRVPANRLTT